MLNIYRDENQVKDYFIIFGAIESVTLAKNLRSTHRNDFAFINFKTRDTARSCVEALSCKESTNKNGPEFDLGMAHLYKNRLQNYAQKRNISFPMYSYETQGPPHARLFKAHVTIDGNSYEGPEFCTTLKDAEHAAAKVAFMALSPDGSQEDDCLYKSLLQELAQKKGVVLPVYVTSRIGPAHVPCFTSTVEVAGKEYVGENARTKKQAEMNAAKVAYIALSEGAPRTTNAPAFPNIQMIEPSTFGSPSLQTAVTQKNEPILLPSSSQMGTAIYGDTNSLTFNESENTKGYLDLKALQDVIQMHANPIPPVVIQQSKPKATPDVNDFAKISISPENVITQAAKAHEGLALNGRRNQISFNEANSNLVIDSGASARPHSTKIVVRPHVPGMTYDGPIQVSDDKWVAMKVAVFEET